MRDKLGEAPGALAVKDKCRHYWIIEGARGPTSRGICKFCGEEREFHNSWSGFATYERRDGGVLELPEALGDELPRKTRELEKSKAGA